MSRARLALFVLALLLVALAWQRLLAAREGLRWEPMAREGVPLLYLAPDDEVTRPGVVVAHGFAGSKKLMLGYAHVLAHAGYRVMLFDFDGHGANGRGLPMTRDGGALQPALDAATAALLAQPGVDEARIALVGHSMGSGAVMTAAIEAPERYAATVAISPTGAAVTPDSPRALQLQAGTWEAPFVANAERLLAAAGGEGATRQFVLVPNAEHITILFRDASHRAALAWLNDALAFDGGSAYRDRRIVWYGAQLVGWLVAWLAVAPMFATPRSGPISSRRRRGLALLLAPLGAAAGLWLSAKLFPGIGTLGGLAVGAAVALWLAIAGAARLAVQGALPRPTARSLGRGLLLGALLWVAFGLMARELWLEWGLVAPRLRLFPWLALGAFPWFLASAAAQAASGARGRLAWWLGESAALVVGLALTLLLVPSLGFLFLVLPTWPLIAGLIALAGAPLRDPWAHALGGTLFMGWLLAAVFPLVA